MQRGLTLVKRVDRTGIKYHRRSSVTGPRLPRRCIETLGTVESGTAQGGGDVNAIPVILDTRLSSFRVGVAACTLPQSPCSERQMCINCAFESTRQVGDNAEWGLITASIRTI